jgi:outer membrane lipoprotein-sorting protein
LNNSQSSEFISDLNIISDNGRLKIISYKDQFGTDTQISFVNIKLNDELDRKIFDYNKGTILVILN